MAQGWGPPCTPGPAGPWERSQRLSSSLGTHQLLAAGRMGTGGLGQGSPWGKGPRQSQGEAQAQHLLQQSWSGQEVV